MAYSGRVSSLGVRPLFKKKNAVGDRLPPTAFFMAISTGGRLKDKLHKRHVRDCSAGNG